MTDLVGVRQRIEELANPGEDVLSYARMDTTDQGEYFLVVREYEHPENDSLRILNLRYAYLTKGSGGDGWVGKDSGAAGINIRVPEGADSAEMLQGLAQMFASSIPRLGGGKDPATVDLTPDSED